MGVPRQEYWNGLPFPSPGDLPNPGIEPMSLVSLMSPALAGRFFTTSATWDALTWQISPPHFRGREAIPEKNLVVRVLSSRWAEKATEMPGPKSYGGQEVCFTSYYFGPCVLWRGWLIHQKWWKKGTSLVVQWLRFLAPSAGGPGSVPGWGTRSHSSNATIKRCCMPQLRPGTA